MRSIIAVEFDKNLFNLINDYFTSITLSDVESAIVYGLYEISDVLAPVIFGNFAILFALKLFGKSFADWKEGNFCVPTFKNDFVNELLTLFSCFVTIFYCSVLLVVTSNQKFILKVMVVAICVSVLLISINVYVFPILQNFERLGVETESCKKVLEKFLKKLDDRI